MKKNILLIGIITGLFVAMYMINEANPAQFVWQPTYDRNDKQPYGAYALDKMLAASWKEDYVSSCQSILDVCVSDDISFEQNLLIVCKHFQLTKTELNLLLDYVKNGGNALIAADFFDTLLEDSLHFQLNATYSNFALPVHLTPLSNHTSIVFLQDSIRNIPVALLRSHLVFTGREDKAFIVTTDEDSRPVLLRYSIGQGNLLLSSTPLLFTNYAVLSDSIHPFIWKALAFLEGKPLVRTEYYERNDHGKSHSPFRYLLSQPSLKWAYYLTIIAVILFMIFTAKRKQKPIPVVQSPPNKMLDFVHSIAGLYLMKNNNADIVLKKYIYWSDALRRKYGMDILNEQHDKTFIQRFSAKTGMDENDARYLFLELDGIRQHTVVSDKEMINLITKMKINSWKN